MFCLFIALNKGSREGGNKDWPEAYLLYISHIYILELLEYVLCKYIYLHYCIYWSLLLRCLSHTCVTCLLVLNKVVNIVYNWKFMNMEWTNDFLPNEKSCLKDMMKLDVLKKVVTCRGQILPAQFEMGFDIWNMWK